MISTSAPAGTSVIWLVLLGGVGLEEQCSSLVSLRPKVLLIADLLLHYESYQCVVGVNFRVTIFFDACFTSSLSFLW